ncbi:Sphingosine-1-phosphate lyase 1 [Varanus komodoensis]|nr:Sphingosine-1-phosphate lyase 1 [Varanus komodoensis]
MRKAELDESPVRIKIVGRNINNLRYADDTTLMAESEEELKSLLMRVKEESAKVGFKLNIKKPKIMASGPLTSWQIDGEEMEVGTDFIFLGSKITADGDCSQEIKRRLLLGRKAMANLDSILKSRDITLPTKSSGAGAPGDKRRTVPAARRAAAEGAVRGQAWPRYSSQAGKVPGPRFRACRKGAEERRVAITAWLRRPRRCPPPKRQLRSRTPFLRPVTREAAWGGTPAAVPASCPSRTALCRHRDTTLRPPAEEPAGLPRTSDAAERLSRVMDAITMYKDIFLQFLNEIRHAVNGKCAGIEAWQLIASTITSTLLIVQLYMFMFQQESLTSRSKKWFFRVIRKLPMIGDLIKKQMNKTTEDMASSLSFLQDKRGYVKALPTKGMTQPEVIKKLKEYSSMGEVRWEDGKVSGTVYSGEEKLTDLFIKVVQHSDGGLQCIQ